MGLDENIFPLQKSRSSKDKLIILIAEKPGLTTRRIQSEFNGAEKENLTYQAIRKSLNNLAQEGVVLKENSGFILNPEWVSSVERFYYFLKRKVDNPLLKDVEELVESGKDGDFVEVNLDSLESLMQFTNDFEPIAVPKMKKKVVCIMVGHTGRFFDLRTMKDRMNLFRKYKVQPYIVYGCDTFIDRIVANFYSDHGARTKTGCSQARGQRIGIYDDIIYQTFLPPDLLAIEDKIFERGKPDSFNFAIYDLFEKINNKKTKVRVVCQRNRRLAAEIASKIIAAFEEKD